MELTHLSPRKGIALRTKRTSGSFYARCCRFFAHPQLKLAYLQGTSLVVGSFVTLWLASLGLSPAELLIYSKVEAFFLVIPMHILTLHLSKEGHN